MQSNCLETDAWLLIIMANLRMKYTKSILKKLCGSGKLKALDRKEMWFICNRQVGFPCKGVKCKSYKNWFHAKRQAIFGAEYKDMQEIVFMSSIVQ